MTENVSWAGIKGLELFAQELWLSGRSTAGIAFDINARYGLGLSKNAIVGKIHRLGMVARPSPIIRPGVCKHPATAGFCPASPIKDNENTLPPLASELPEYVPSAALVTAKAERRAIKQTRQRPVKTVEILAKPPPVFQPRACCWPIGQPGNADFHFCDDPVFERKMPYCTEHSKLAYTKIRHHEERERAV